MGRQLGMPAVTNFWIPDGYKDTPDRPQKRPASGLKRRWMIFLPKPIDPKHNLDAVDNSLFGIGAESYVVGSHEFYLGYAVTSQVLLSLDAGHYHPDRGSR